MTDELKEKFFDETIDKMLDMILEDVSHPLWFFLTKEKKKELLKRPVSIYVRSAARYVEGKE